MTGSTSEARERPGGRTWTLRRRLGQAFGAIAVLLALLGAAVVVSAALFVRAGDQVINQWAPAAITSSRVLTDVVDQETGLRGYALSHDPADLRRYERYGTTLNSDLSRLRRHVGGDAALGRALTAVQQDIARWRSDVAEPAIRAITAADPAGPALVHSAAATSQFDDIRAKTSAVDRLVQNRNSHARSDRRADGVVVVIAIALLLLVGLFAGLLLWRGLHRWVLAPVNDLGRRTREVARGQTHREIVADGPLEFAALGRDVEAMRLQIAGELARAARLVDELQVRTAELARSNDDLQQFAYVASHDLSEPLRKVANFCQLIERQYGPQLDDRARQYIEFAVDGAKRMQILITDLLALSRVGRTTEQFVDVDLEAALDQAVANLGDRFVSSGATLVRSTALPTVPGDRSLLTSLLENLVGNAVKYCRDDVAPRIVIGAAPDPDGWLITVSDNGIGIAPQYAERIFAVFQRLHLRDQYGGTGIGLALCRRIVEFHGGRIWLDVDVPAADDPDTGNDQAAVVESSDGATFRFTLPEGVAGAEPHDR